jgi:acyl carrier protein
VPQLVLEQLRRLVPTLEPEPAPSLWLQADVGLDSLDLVEFVLLLEQAFHRELPDGEIGGWRTLEDVYRSVERQTSLGLG